MKFRPGQDRREAGDEDAQRRRNDAGVRRRRAVRRVERPAGVHAAGDHRVDDEDAAEPVDVQTEQIDARKRQILGANHRRDQEVAERRRNRRDQEQEHHDHAVQREELVVGVGLDEVALRRRELEADADRHEAAEEEEDRDRDQIHDRDPLVVLRQQPRLEAVAVVQIMTRGKFECVLHDSLPATAGPARRATAAAHRPSPRRTCDGRTRRTCRAPPLATASARAR